MTFRKATLWAVCALALGSFGNLSSAHAQGAPFTIRKPADGSHVREKVRIEIPRPSIGPGGFVAFYLDPEQRNGGTFLLALAPPQEEEDTGKPFTYVWDTKATGVSDGEHTIRAILYEPASSGNIAMNEKGTTEIHVTVENKIKPGPDVPTSFLLRYKYREGEALEYSRSGKSVVVGHGSDLDGVNSDIEIMSARSKLLFSVEDLRYDPEAQAQVALVRNKLTQLSVLNGGQEYTLAPTALSNSMYQELLPEGRVRYETGTATGLTEFMAQGLPVNNTLELPLMPTLRVSIGDQWDTPNQRLDIPGLPPILQPLVKLSNKLVDLEYEQGYPCAKIHQHFEGQLSNLVSEATQGKLKVLPFGPMLITSPTLTYDRDIYLAYNSGILVRTVRSLTIKGRTTSPLGAPENHGAQPGAGNGFGNPNGFGPRSGGPGSFGPGGPGSFGPGGPPVKGGGPSFSPGGPGSFGPSARGGGPGSFGPGGPGSFGPGPRTGAPGSFSPGSRGGGPGSFGPGGFPGAPGGYPGGNGTQEVDHAVTVRSSSDTEILSQAPGVAASKPSVKPASSTSKKKGRK